VKTRTRSAIFAAFSPLPVFEVIASFAEAFALSHDVSTATEIGDRNRRRALNRSGKNVGKERGQGSGTIRLGI